MTYDYFYGQQAEMFAFYRVPKVLFTEDCFWNVSTDAKLLYGILLDRMNLSARNGWLDEEGRVYIIFTIEEIKGALGCAEKKAVKLLDELEKKCGLIERKRQGLGKPNLIYVKNFISGSVERQFLNCQKDNSGVVKNTIQELSKAQGNNTDTNYIDFSDTDPFFPSGFCGKEVDETDEFTRYYQYFYEQLSMDYLKQDYPYDHEILDLILHLIIEVMCSNRKQIRIASDDKPIEIVKSSFMKLDSEHIRFVMSSFKENTTDVRNIKQYLLASIYNAPYTISAHYDAKVRHDIPRGIWPHKVQVKHCDFFKFPLGGFRNHKVSHADKSPPAVFWIPPAYRWGCLPAGLPLPPFVDTPHRIIWRKPPQMVGIWENGKKIYTIYMEDISRLFPLPSTRREQTQMCVYCGRNQRGGKRAADILADLSNTDAEPGNCS